MDSSAQQILPESIRKLFPYESHFYQAGMYKLHYIDEGKGPVVVMLHACPMWSFFYHDLIRELSKDHRVIALDQMGFGLSDKPLDYDYRMETHIDHLERFITDLELHDITLIMHGRGTTIGIGYAVKNPSNVAGFLAMNAMAFSDFRLPWRLQICRIPWLGAKIIMELGIFHFDAKRLKKDVAEAYDYPLKGHDSRIGMLRFAEQIPCTPEDDSAQSMFEIESGVWLLRDKPSCLLWAMKDWLYRPHNLKAWKQYFPNAEVHCLERAGRYLSEDSREEFLGITKSFLQQHGL